MGDASVAAGAAKWIAALIEEGKYLYGVEDQLRRLQRDLEYMKVFLLSIEVNPRRVKEDGTLRILIQDIRELAFRAEDVVDTYIVDVRSRVFRENLFSKLACLVSNCYPVHMLRKAIEDIQKDLKDAMERSKDFGVIIPTTSQQRGSNVGPSSSRCIPEDYIHLDDEVVVGIDDAISQLVERLTDPNDDFKAIAIVGTGGGGKTTLATQLYRHSKVASWFPHKVFVSISQQWRRGDLLIRIFKQVKGKGCEIPSIETEIVRELHEFFKDEQCLIVLDDMWEKNAWDDICPIFSRGNKGCRFLLTTRNREVALHLDNKCVIHEPQLLSEDQKWELFRKVAMEGRTHIERNGAFETLGKQMVGKCEGLPLAVVTLAGILRTKKELYEWEEISNACNENILKGKEPKYGVVEDMLELSYCDLPAYLKPCFLYLACFHEGFVTNDLRIGSDDLIRMWIAEGFVTNDLRMGQGTLEDAAMRLIKELAQRCIIQVREENYMGQIVTFRIHDLMREFCIKYANDSLFCGTISSTYDANVEPQSQPRRIGINLSGDYAIENNHLRTLSHYGDIADLENSIKKLDSFKLLRVLCLVSTESFDNKMVTLPKQIGELIHLRCLILCIPIREFPKSIRNLRNLLYFECQDFGDNLEILNDLAWKMENLRGLVLRDYDEHRFNLKSLGLKSGSKHLQRLSSNAGKWVTKDIPTLSPTLRNLSIYFVEEMEEMEAIYRCPSIVKGNLSTLKLLGEVGFDLQKVKHCTKLQSLKLYCPVSTINSAVGTVQYFPPNLVQLRLTRSGIEQDDLLQVIGELPKLKSLSLLRKAYLGKRLSCSAGNAFPQLEELELWFLDNLEEWGMEKGAMPRLRRIEIIACPKLKRLPKSIRSITTLKELHIKQMPEEFCTRLGYGESSPGGEDSDLIRHIPTIKFTDII